MKPIGAGSEIDAWCTKCRMDLGHRIVAMVKDRPARVVCMTCNSEHRYLATRGGNGAGAVTRKASTTGRTKAAPRLTQRALAEQERVRAWEARIAGKPVDAFLRYSMDRTFSPGQLVLHKKFGEGYIVDVLEDGKVDVMFRDGSRTLAHGQA